MTVFDLLNTSKCLAQRVRVQTYDIDFGQWVTLGDYIIDEIITLAQYVDLRISKIRSWSYEVYEITPGVREDIIFLRI